MSFSACKTDNRTIAFQRKERIIPQRNGGPFRERGAKIKGAPPEEEEKEKTIMEEVTKMLEETIEECDEMAQQDHVQEPDICVSTSEDETKLFWEVTTDQQLDI